MVAPESRPDQLSTRGPGRLGSAYGLSCCATLQEKPRSFSERFSSAVTVVEILGIQKGNFGGLLNLLRTIWDF